MEIAHLRHFIAVAEELHFGRAAARLGMAQPPLSQSIRRLELSLGAPLFKRTSRQVMLTPAGKVLLEEARQVVARMERAEKATRRVISGEVNQLRIGFAPWVLMDKLPKAVRAFRRKWPGIAIHLEERGSQMLIRRIRDGAIDLGLFNLITADLEGLQSRVVGHSRFMAAVPASWPIAKQKSILLAELAKLPFVLFPQRHSPKLYDAIFELCRGAGFIPEIVEKSAQPNAILCMVASEVGVTLADDAIRHFDVEGVTMVPVRDLPDQFGGALVAAWLPEAETPVLRSLIQLIESAEPQPSMTKSG